MNTQNPYESPTTDVSAAAPAAPAGQALAWILFSFEGRIPRRIFWGVSLGMSAVFILFYPLVFAVFGEESPVTAGVIFITYIPLIWILLAVQVKRWHDRDKSGWWVLIQLIPIIGPIWAFIETGCLRGTVGANSFGPDPT